MGQLNAYNGSSAHCNVIIGGVLNKLSSRVNKQFNFIRFFYITQKMFTAKDLLRVKIKSNVMQHPRGHFYSVHLTI